jgi:CheY-like chemotaxis protein
MKRPTTDFAPPSNNPTATWPRTSHPPHPPTTRRFSTPDLRLTPQGTENRAFPTVWGLDYMTPGLDGYETTAEIRRREGAASRAPIVATAASAMQGATASAVSPREWTTIGASP